MCERKQQGMEEEKNKTKMKRKKMESWGEGEKERYSGKDDAYHCEE